MKDMMKISKKTGRVYCRKQGECYCAAHKPHLHPNYFKIYPERMPLWYELELKLKETFECTWCKKRNNLEDKREGDMCSSCFDTLSILDEISWGFFMKDNKKCKIQGCENLVNLWWSHLDNDKQTLCQQCSIRIHGLYRGDDNDWY